MPEKQKKEKVIDHHKIGRSSKAKGAAGERELAKKLNELLGIDSIRGRQFCGSAGNPDVILQKKAGEERLNIPGLHIECKRVEQLNLYKALKQSESDAKPDEIPVVCHRRNQDTWIISFRLDKLKDVAKWVQSLEELDNGESGNS